MIEHAIVFIVVAVASGYAVWRLMPRTLRARSAATLVRLAQRRAGLSREQAARIERRIAVNECSACDSCGGCGSSRPDSAGRAGIKAALTP